MSSIVVEVAVDAIVPQQEAPQRWHVLGRLEKTAIGTRGAGGVTTVRRREQAGCFLYGPYWQLRAGSYRLSFRCRPEKPRLPGEPVLGVEVVAMNRVQLAWIDLTTAELHGEAGFIDFIVPPTLGLGGGDEARLEFRFFHMGNANLTITAVDLQSTAHEEQCSAPLRVWRMLGRLEKTAIVSRSATGLTVPRRKRAGRVLDCGRPFLQLPAGHYRVHLGCDAARPRMAAQPVLGVEIIARRRWQEDRRWKWNSLLGPPFAGAFQLAWHDFTAAELAAGPASFGFEVPPERSLEGGQDFVIGVRIIHLGNADLTIRAAEIRQVSADGAARAPREWRLFGRLGNSRIGTREGDGVIVRRADPPGAFLYGGRPMLRLPTGRYRLSFCCRVGEPASSSEPVLDLEVIARKRTRTGGRRSLQARAEFTAAALTTGQASLDFAVPPELGSESRNEVGFEFRFLHLGNADLALNAVSLHEIVNVDPPAVSSPSLLSSRRTNVLIVGNCQAQTIHETLARSGEFNDRLDVKYHFVALQQNLRELGRSELESTDVMLVQDIRDWENYPLREYIPDDVRIVKFPLLHFASLWPFDHYNGPGDKEAYDREWPNLSFLYHDGLLARLRKEILDPEQRLAAYRSLSVDGIVNFARLHDFERRRLTAMDKQFGCEIGRFILENFQRRRLFYTTNHPNGKLIGMLMQFLLRQMEMDGGFRSTSSLDHLRRLQVPVHPKVAQALGVGWANEKTKYLYGGEEITWETYVRRYIEHYG